MTESGGGRAGSLRCAVHPARIAADACPRCARPRCGAHATAFGPEGCAGCTSEARPAPAAPPQERLVRAGLAAYVVALLGGWIGTEYVGVHYFAVVAPALVGLACGWAATAAVGRGVDPRLRRTALVVAAFAAVLSAALAFRIDAGGGDAPLGSWGDVGPPYLFAVLGTLAWPVAFGPPDPARRRRRRT